MTSDAVVIIRGAPGTGKSTLAGQLMLRWGRGATVEVDSLRGMINQIDWTSHQQHFDGIRAAASVCRHYLVCDYSPVVLIDTFGYGSLEIATEELGDVRCTIVTLTSSNAALKWRLVRRFGGYRDWRNAQKFNEHIRLALGEHDVTFDTSEIPAKAIANKIMELLETTD